MSKPFHGVRNVSFLEKFAFIIIIIIIINHLFHFSTSILHGSSSKTKIYGS